MPALLVALACGGDYAPPREPIEAPFATEDEAWAAARTHLVDAHDCLLNRADYCLDAPEEIDPILQVTVDRLFDGHMPLRRRDVAEVVSVARPVWAEWMTKDGFARVNARVAAHYQRPTVAVGDDGAVAAVGLPAGTLRRTRKGLALETPYLDRGAWTAAEAARVFTLLEADAPGLRRYRADLVWPRGEGLARVSYLWDRDGDRLLVHDRDVPDAVWFTPLAGGGLTTLAGLDLHPTALTRCPVDRPGGPPHCP